MRNIYSKSKSIPVVYHTKRLRRKGKDVSVTTAQEAVPGFELLALTRSTIILLGLGGVGSQIALALARKGAGNLVLLDHDIVEPSNLPRQVYYPKDVGKPKAYQLAANLAKEGVCDQTFSGYHLSFQDAIARGIDLSGSLAIVGVDSNPGRIAASAYYRERGVPVIFSAVSRSADHGYVFVQEPKQILKPAVVLLALVRRCGQEEQRVAILVPPNFLGKLVTLSLFDLLRSVVHRAQPMRFVEDDQVPLAVLQ